MTGEPWLGAGPAGAISEAVISDELLEDGVGEAEVAGLVAADSGAEGLGVVVVAALVDVEEVDGRAALAVDEDGQLLASCGAQDLHCLAFLEGIALDDLLATFPDDG